MRPEPRIREDVPAQLKETPSVTAVAPRLLCMVGEPDTCEADLGRKVSHHQALPARVLPTCRSSSTPPPGQESGLLGKAA